MDNEPLDSETELPIFVVDKTSLLDESHPNDAEGVTEESKAHHEATVSESSTSDSDSSTTSSLTSSDSSSLSELSSDDESSHDAIVLPQRAEIAVEENAKALVQSKLETTQALCNDYIEPSQVIQFEPLSPTQFLGYVLHRLGDLLVISHDTLIRDRRDIALDINTILCLEDRRIIGTISDVVGSIEKPVYLVQKPLPRVYDATTKSDQVTRLRIVNVSHAVVEEEFLSILELYGDITHVTFSKNFKGFFSGTVEVEYYHRSSAELLLSHMNGTLYLGKVIQMSFVDPNAPVIESSTAATTGKKKKKKKNRTKGIDENASNTTLELPPGDGKKSEDGELDILSNETPNETIEKVDKFDIVEELEKRGDEKNELLSSDTLHSDVVTIAAEKPTSIEIEISADVAMSSDIPLVGNAMECDRPLAQNNESTSAATKPLTEKQLKFEFYRSKQEESFLSVKPNDKVYYFLDFSSLAIPEELYFPGTDASCRNDVESNKEEFSDDEKEREFKENEKKKLQAKFNQSKPENSSSGSTNSAKTILNSSPNKNTNTAPNRASTKRKEPHESAPGIAPNNANAWKANSNPKPLKNRKSHQPTTSEFHKHLQHQFASPSTQFATSFPQHNAEHLLQPPSYDYTTHVPSAIADYNSQPMPSFASMPAVPHYSPLPMPNMQPYQPHAPNKNQPPQRTMHQQQQQYRPQHHSHQFSNFSQPPQYYSQQQMGMMASPAMNLGQQGAPSIALQQQQLQHQLQQLQQMQQQILFQQQQLQMQQHEHGAPLSQNTYHSAQQQPQPYPSHQSQHNFGNF